MHSLAFGFHIYVIYTTKRLDAQRNKQTIRNRSLSSFKMQSQSHEFSYFLNCEKDLESLAEDYFSARPAEAEDDQLYAILAKGTKMSTAAIASVDVLLTGTLIHRLTKTSLF